MATNSDNPALAEIRNYTMNFGRRMLRAKVHGVVADLGKTRIV